MTLSIPKGSLGVVESTTTHGYTCVNFNLLPKVQTGDLEYIGNQLPKTAFLTELKELMEKYDAEFGDYEGYRVHFKIGNEYIGWDTLEGDVTPENIFDYDK